MAFVSKYLVYWIYNYNPKFEAASKELHKLFGAFGPTFGAQIISQDFQRITNVHPQGHRSFKLPYSLFFLPVFVKIASSTRINHIFSSLAEKVLIPRICHLNTLITITKDTDSLSTFEKRIDYFAQAKYVVVESERHREILVQSGIAEKKVKLIYPGVRSKPFKKAAGPFRILFATSPMGEHGLLTRGVFLLLHAAGKMPEVQFTIVWRGTRSTKLAKAIEESKIANIELISGYVSNMDEVYDAVHATILPGITYSSLKPCPHSALESLAHGKPVLVSYPTSISTIISRNHCGVVFEPNIESAIVAIEHLRENYDWYQQNCHSTIEKSFSEDVFIDRYRGLYLSML